MAWGKFGECIDNVMKRTQVIVTLPVGEGMPCPEIQLEEERGILKNVYQVDCLTAHQVTLTFNPRPS